MEDEHPPPPPTFQNTPPPLPAAGGYPVIDYFLAQGDVHGKERTLRQRLCLVPVCTVPEYGTRWALM